MAALEVFNGGKWVRLVDSDYMQAAIILPILAAGTNNSASVIQQVDGVTIPVGGLFLLTGQAASSQNGVYMLQANLLGILISPQPLGVYVINGTTKANKLFFNAS